MSNTYLPQYYNADHDCAEQHGTTQPKSGSKAQHSKTILLAISITTQLQTFTSYTMTLQCYAIAPCDVRLLLLVAVVVRVWNKTEACQQL